MPTKKPLFARLAIITVLIVGTALPCFSRTMKALLSEANFNYSLDNIQDSLENIGYSVTQAKPASRATFSSLGQYRGVWYHMSHGHYVNTPGVHGGAWRDRAHYIENSSEWYSYVSLPTGLSFKLVFLNACYSGTSPLGLNWKTYTGATAYVGIDGSMSEMYATGFAEKFFGYCGDGYDASNSLSKAKSGMPAGEAVKYILSGNVDLSQ